MGIYSKLKSLMELNNMSDAELSRLSGVPVSSIYSMKMRDSNKTDLEVLKSIASVFGVNISFFVSDNPSDFIRLSEEEASLVLKYRLLDKVGVNCVNAVINCHLNNEK
ncbi:MAG: helix-turn-helix transcriptional regulator [Clostridia bacterium]|nr:helix-turn-helix transcriptional regulator [Clostridia bacterium]